MLMAEKIACGWWHSGFFQHKLDVAFWLPTLLIAASAAGATVPVIEDAGYANDAAAQAAWRPMAGSSPVSIVNQHGLKAIRFPCRFSGAAIERASWDRKVSLDLSGCQGIQLKVFCSNPSPISGFTLYFQSGNGWYSARFFPESTSEWNEIILDKASMRSEGRPAGWEQITTLRLSAWKGGETDTEFYITDMRRLGELGSDALIAVIRGDSAANNVPSEKRAIEQYCGSMVQMLASRQIGCTVISDLEVTADTIKKAAVVILPHNPQMPDRAVDELKKYAQNGGKIIVFFFVPAGLRTLLGIEDGPFVKATPAGLFSRIHWRSGAIDGMPEIVEQKSWNIHSFKPAPGKSGILAVWEDEKGNPTGHAAVIGSSNGMVMTHVLLNDGGQAKLQMLQAMVGFLAPAIWQQAAESRLSKLGAIGGFPNWEQAAAGIARMGRDKSKAVEALSAAQNARARARQLALSKQYAKALDEMDAAERKLLEAFCSAQPSQRGEWRAFWCHNAYGVDGMNWEQALAHLAKNGFTAIVPNMLWGGAAYYPSKVLPVADEVSRRGDALAECVAAAKKHGLQIHVWKVNWNLGHAVPREFVARLRQEGRLQADNNGNEEPWLCPSHPENQKLEIESMLEVARNYAVDGLHFDYIRYPGGQYCFCNGCRQRFEKAIGQQIQNWPKDVLAGGPHRQRWLDWRRDNITSVVRAVSEQAKKIRPGIKISAAVFPRWNTDRDTVGQDWKLWCEKGWLDFACPMNYTPSDGAFNGLVERQLQWAGKTPLYPGIGASTLSRLMPDKVIEQIQIARNHKTGGFIVFNYGRAEAMELLPLLGMGVTAIH